MKNPLRRLKDLKLSNVDFVPLGANPGAHITLVKENPLAAKVIELLKERDGGDAVLHEIADDGTVTFEYDGSLWRAACTHGADGAVTLSEPTRVVQEHETSHPDEEPHVSDTATAELEKAREDAEAAEAELQKAREEAEELRKQLEAKPEEGEVRKELDETRAELQKQSDELAELKKERREREFLAKAMEFDGLGATDRIAGLLDEADQNLSEGANETLTSLLRGAAEQVKQGHLFKQFSQAGGDEPETAAEKLEKLAKERHEADPSKTVEQHKLAIARENRELVREMAAERS